jgi:hypothetical protein
LNERTLGFGVILPARGNDSVYFVRVQVMGGFLFPHVVLQIIYTLSKSERLAEKYFYFYPTRLWLLPY